MRKIIQKINVFIEYIITKIISAFGRIVYILIISLLIMSPLLLFLILKRL